MNERDKPISDPSRDAADQRPGLRRNVELKARLASLDTAREVARRVATSRLGIQHQTDTYFHCPHGRLKLREMADDGVQLIWYARSDQAEARHSEYYLLDVADGNLAKNLLTAALGVRRTVIKRREIFLYRNVRIHLDDVVDLGSFLEFEAVMAPRQDLAEGHAQLAWLCEQFGITASCILPSSYGDML